MASGTDRHLDITFGLQVVESSSLVSILFREAFRHPYFSFFHLLVNGFSVTCNKFKILSSITSDEIPPRSLQFISIGSYSPEVCAFGTPITSTNRRATL